MDLQAMLTDNQIAILGCFAALAACGAIGMMSFQFGTAGRRTLDEPASGDAIRSLPQRSESDRDRPSRRAA